MIYFICLMILAIIVGLLIAPLMSLFDNFPENKNSSDRNWRD